MISAHYNPFFEMYAAAIRKTSQGYSLGEAEKITRNQMLRTFTIDSAYLTFEEDIKGSIEPGKLADLAVLSKGPLTCTEGELLNTKVDMTISDGKVYNFRN